MSKRILAALSSALLFATTALASVDVNKATAAELDGIKGIGPGTSRTILDERRKGEFRSWSELIQRVKGLGGKRAAMLSDAGLRVNGYTYSASDAKR